MSNSSGITAMDVRLVECSHGYPCNQREIRVAVVSADTPIVDIFSGSLVVTLGRYPTGSVISDPVI
jgi:hypothetical protein